LAVTVSRAILRSLAGRRPYTDTSEDCMRSLRVSVAATFATLALVMSAAPGVARAQALPSPKEVMDKNDAALGGRAALDKHSSVHQVGTMSVAAAGIDAQIELFKAKPSKYMQRIALGAMGEVTQGFDGVNAWAVQPGQGPILLDSAQTEAFKTLADYYGNFHDMARYKSTENTGVVDFDGRKCYKIKIVKLSGSEGFEFYDVSTGMIAGIQAQVDSPMGKIDQTNVFSEFKEFGGLKMPTKIQQKNGQFDATISFTNVEFDNVDPAVFVIPEALKAKAKPVP
jgi:hypothetical protein